MDNLPTEKIHTQSLIELTFNALFASSFFFPEAGMTVLLQDRGVGIAQFNLATANGNTPEV